MTPIFETVATGVAEVTKKVVKEVAKEVVKEVKESVKDGIKDAADNNENVKKLVDTADMIVDAKSSKADKSINFDARVKNLDVSENLKNAFDLDKRVKAGDIVGKELQPFDPDKRVERNFTTAEERIELAKNSNGVWDGEQGNSKFHPNDADAQKALKDYKQDGIDYREGNPDFSKCSESEVRIDNMTSDRPSNFRQADEQCSKQWNLEKRDGRTDWSPRDVREWRSENRYSWHERIDRKTMDLVQRDVHEECKHFGGVAECKRYENLLNNK